MPGTESFALASGLSLSLFASCSQSSVAAVAPAATVARSGQDPVQRSAAPAPSETTPWTAARGESKFMAQACETRLHDLVPEGFYGAFTMQLPPEVTELEPWGTSIYLSETGQDAPISCEAAGARATMSRVTIHRLSTRGERASHDLVLGLSMAVIHPHSYSPKSCSREKRTCWRREATIRTVGEAVYTTELTGNRVETVLEIGGGPDEEREITRMAVLGVARGGEVFVVTFEAPLDDWTALAPSIEASIRTFAFRSP